MKTSAEGAEEDDAMEGWNVGPSGLKTQALVVPRPDGRGY